MSFYQTTVQGKPVPIVADDFFQVTPDDNSDILHPDTGKPAKGILQADGGDVTVKVDIEYLVNNKAQRYTRGPITIKDGEFLNAIVYKVWLTDTAPGTATIWLYV